MVFYNEFRLLLFVFAAVAAQFIPQMPQMASMPQMAPMPQMPHGPYPFFPQGQQMIQMPGGMPLGMMSRLPGMQASIPMSQLGFNNGGRLPMVVMPHHTKKKDQRKKPRKTRRRYRKYFKGSSSEEDSRSSEEVFRTKNDVRSSKKNKQEILTPVVSYVTKDGYVIYQKKIKKEKAKDWLELAKDHSGEFFEKVARNKKHHEHDH